MGMLGMRWFRSRAVQAPIAKTLGGIWLLMFVPALLAILPGHICAGWARSRSKAWPAASSATS
jgi:predicted Na+-dependent transporter